MIQKPPTLAEQLDRLSKTGPAGGRPASVSGTSRGVTWKVDVDRVESLGCQVHRCRVKLNSLPRNAAGPDEVARRMCKRVGYLLEPLDLLEFDGQADQAIVRSTQVTAEPEGNGFFECTVDRQSITIERFAARTGQPRKPVPFSVTRQTLDRLVDDLSQSLHPPRHKLLER